MKFYCDLNRLRENRTNIKELEKKRFFALKIPWGLAPCRFDSDRRHQFFQLVRDPPGSLFFWIEKPVWTMSELSRVFCSTNKRSNFRIASKASSWSTVRCASGHGSGSSLFLPLLMRFWTPLFCLLTADLCKWRQNQSCSSEHIVA